MSHRICSITEARVVAPRTLLLRFDDGLERIIDFTGVLHGEMYGPLRDDAVFRQVKLDPDFDTVVWPNGADFDPAILHDWPGHESAFKSAAKSWASPAVPA